MMHLSTAISVSTSRGMTTCALYRASVSPEYAALQVHRVAERNGLSVRQVRELVEAHTEGRTLGFIGEPRVDVLELNIALRDLVGGS